jgi:HipA-like C-terminal domain
VAKRRILKPIGSVDHFRVIKDITVRGATEKDILEDPQSGNLYIAKLGGRNNDLEVMTEYAIFLVGRSLGVLVADARIASYNGRLRFLSKYFLDRRKSEELVHGMQLFSELYDENTVTAVLGDERSEQEMFRVQAVKAAFGAHYLQYGPHLEDDLFGGFVSMLTHDALIGVMDRHHENWGVIVQRGREDDPPRFAPLYDSARGLFCNVTDSQMASRFLVGERGERELDKYVAKSRPLVGCEGLLVPRGRKFVTHDQLLAAVYRAYPNQRERILRILASYDWRRVRDDLNRDLAVLCSARRRMLILRCLRRRIRVLRRAIDGVAN